MVKDTGRVVTGDGHRFSLMIRSLRLSCLGIKISKKPFKHVFRHSVYDLDIYRMRAKDRDCRKLIAKSLTQILISDQMLNIVVGSTVDVRA